jgi:predicted neutral ceramidase superfamily lipid hydrolase
MTNKEIQSQVNEITKEIYQGTQLAFKDLEELKRITYNVKIEVSRLGNTESGRVLSKIGDIIAEAVDKIETYTKGGRDASKQIAQLINQLNTEE